MRLLKGLRLTQVTRYSDYKWFNVETLATIGKPKQPAAKGSRRRNRSCGLF